MAARKIWRTTGLVLLVTSITMMHTFGQKLAKNEPVKFLALGDSYTVGESVAEPQRWPVQLTNALMLNGYTCHQPEIVAATGWTTDDLKKAIGERKLPKDFNLVSLLIGVNNQYRGKSVKQYRSEFEDLLKIAIAYGSGMSSNVIVLSIPDYGYTPFGKDNQEEISKQIDAFNEANKAISEQYGVTYIDITGISRQAFSDAELVADDGLHPSGKMYALWVEKILKVIR